MDEFWKTGKTHPILKNIEKFRPKIEGKSYNFQGPVLGLTGCLTRCLWLLQVVLYNDDSITILEKSKIRCDKIIDSKIMIKKKKSHSFILCADEVPPPTGIDDWRFPVSFKLFTVNSSLNCVDIHLT